VSGLLHVIALAGVVVSPGAGDPDPGPTPKVVGHYLEARTSDVYTGPCFANGEVNLDGEEAVLAWQITEGGWGGADLSGLSVVAAVKAESTLGDPYGAPARPRAVIVVDERADTRQSAGLESLARELGGELLAHVVAVHRAPIEARFDQGVGVASIRAGGLIEASTRPLGHGDHLCGNESIYYPPLTGVRDATPAYTLSNAFRGSEFDSTWSTPSKRSSFVAEFAR